MELAEGAREAGDVAAQHKARNAGSARAHEPAAQAASSPLGKRWALIVGVSEALADIYLGPLVQGSVSTWFAYVLALAFLLVRPAGLFGEKLIERV